MSSKTISLVTSSTSSASLSLSIPLALKPMRNMWPSLTGWMPPMLIMFFLNSSCSALLVASSLPLTKYVVVLTLYANMVSSWATSIFWPIPVLSRCRNAARIAIAAIVPGARSPKAPVMVYGGPSGSTLSPCCRVNPEIDSAIIA